MKKRILNGRLAAIVANIRHGEMLFIADAGSGTSEKALYPLSPSVEYLDLGAVTGSPSFRDIVSVLVEAGDFEGAIVTDVMPELNPEDYNYITELLGKENIHEMNYIPIIIKCATAARLLFRREITAYTLRRYLSRDIQAPIFL